ncbi:hypothetical protein GCM10028791_05620 [Echinicola sediminis]
MSKLIILHVIGLFLILNTGMAQERMSPRSENIYVELGGPGLFSFNYDTRFVGRTDGIGGRAGIGYMGIDGSNVLSIPLGLNYLLGKDDKFFELGINATYFSASVDLDWGDDGSDSASSVIGSLIFGYRKQPADGGFLFKAGLSPYFNSNFFYPFVPYISFGYAF